MSGKRLAGRIWVAAAVAMAACLVAGSALAAEEARYSFASAQGGGQIAVPQAGEGRGTLYFYNVDGNRITHVSLRVSQAPADWEVSVEPAWREVPVAFNGELVKVGENLHVEPSALLAREASPVPEGMACIAIPGRGYALAKVAHVVARAPAGAAVGTGGEVRVLAEAAWLGQGGAATIKQAREFTFVVAVAAPGGYSETVLGQGGDDGLSGLLWTWLPPVLAGAVGFLAAMVLQRRRGSE